VIETLTSHEWKVYMEKSDKIFINAPGHNKELIFNEDTGIDIKDSKIKSIPFNTTTPTFTQVKYSFNQLSTINIIFAYFIFQKKENYS
jgi:hypothetical protein